MAETGGLTCIAKEMCRTIESPSVWRYAIIDVSVTHHIQIVQPPQAPVTTKAPAAIEMMHSQMNRKKEMAMSGAHPHFLSWTDYCPISKSDHNYRTEAMRLPVPSPMHQMDPTLMTTTTTSPLPMRSHPWVEAHKRLYFLFPVRLLCLWSVITSWQPVDYVTLSQLHDEHLRLWYRGYARVQPPSAGKGLLTSSRVPMLTRSLLSLSSINFYVENMYTHPV